MWSVAATVRFVMFILYPLAKPMALLLDLLLGGGAKPASYRRYDIVTRDEDISADSSAEVATIAPKTMEIVTERP